MSEEEGLKFVIGGDIAPIQQALQQVEQQAQATGQKIDQLNQKNTQAAQQGAQGWTGLTVKVDEAGKATEKLGQEAKTAGQSTQQAAQQGAQSMGQLATETKGAEGAMTGLGASAKAVGASIAALGLGALFHEMTAGIGESAEKFATFEQSLNQIAAVSDATAKDLEQLRAKALQVGISTGLGAQQAADGMVELAKAGFTAEQSMTAIEGVMALARAGGVDVAQAAELAGGALRGFGLEADQAGRVADIMAQAANKSAVDIRDLQVSMKYIAPIAASSGQSIEEMSGALAIMGNSMIKGSQAGTTLRAAIERLIKPHKEGAEALHEMGIAVQDTAGRMLPLGDILDQLRTATAKYTDVQKEAKLAAIFGVEALSGMMALINAGPEAYNTMTGSMDEATGAAKHMGDTMNQGLGPALKALNNSMDEAKTLMGEQFAPAIKLTAEQLKALITWFNQLDPSTKSLIAAIGAGTTAVVGLGAAAATAALAVGVLAAVGVDVAAVLLGPFGLALLAAGLAVGALTGAAIDSSEAAKVHAEALDSASQAQAQTAIKASEAAEELSKLATEHDNLTDKTNLTKEEQQRLHVITERLKKAYPELAAAVEAAGESHWATLAPMQAEINKQKDLEAQTYKTLKAEMALATFLMAQAGIQAKQSHDKLAKTQKTYTNAAKSGVTLDHGGLETDIEAAKGADADYMAASMRLAAASKAIDDIDASKWTFSGSVGDVAGHGSAVAGGKGHAKGKGKGKSGSGTEAALDRMQLQADDKAATEAAKIAEAVAAKKLAIAKGEVEAEIAMLAQKRDAGAITQAQYLDKFATLKARELQLSNDAELAKIDAERTAAQAKIDAAKKAVDRANGDTKITADQRKKLVADAQNKQAEATNALTVLNQKRETAEIQGIARIAAADSAATKARIAETTKAYAAEEELAKKTKEANQEAANEEEANRAKSLGFYDRVAAEAALSFEKQRQAAEKAYHDEEVRLIGLAMAGQNVDEAWKAMERTRTAALTGIATDEKKTAEQTKTAWVGGIKEIESEIGGLVSSPSLGKVGDLLGGFAADPTKWDRWTSSLGKATDAIGALFSGSEKADTSLGGLGAVVTTLAGPMGALFAVGQSVSTMFDNQAKAVKALADNLVNVNAQVAKLRAENEQDPLKKATLVRDNKLADLYRDISKRETDDHAAEQAAREGFHLGPVDDKSWENTLARNDFEAEAKAKIQREYNDDVYAAGEPARKKAEAERTAAIKDAKGDAKDLASSLKDLNSEATDLSGNLADALGKMGSARDAITAAQKEIDDGGRDASGNHTSLEAEKLLKLHEQDTAYQKQRNQLLDQQKKLEQEITKTEEDRAKAVRDIQNEGIAQRAKTEFQDKTERIAKVNLDAATKTADLTKQVDDTKASINDLEIQHGYTVDGINNQYKDRLKLLGDEITKQQQLLVIEQQRAAAAGRAIAQAAASGAPVANLNTDKLMGGGGSLVWDTNQGYGHWVEKHHTGGTAGVTGRRVPGAAGADVPTVLQAGEFVLTAPQMTYLLQASAGGGQGGGNVTITGPIAINLPPGSGQDQARAFLSALDSHAGSLVRQRGGLRI